MMAVFVLVSRLGAWWQGHFLCLLQGYSSYWCWCSCSSVGTGENHSVHTMFTFSDLSVDALVCSCAWTIWAGNVHIGQGLLQTEWSDVGLGRSLTVWADL